MKTTITFLFSFCFFFTSHSQVIESDSLALVDFYNAMGGPGWTDNSNWLSNSPVGEWFGISISDQRVTGIDLYDNNLTGSLPSEIGALSGLTRIYLPSNAIDGAIPAEIGQCTTLNTLDLSVNNISGTFPQEISMCQQLSAITMYRNELSGSFPIVLLSLPNLWRLELGENNLAGEIPSGLNDLVNLRLLDLARNSFSGQMISLKNLTEMTEFHIYENDLYGDIADIFNYSPNMYYLSLSNNHFTGCLSDSFFNPVKLQFFDFSQNDFDCLGDFSAFADTGVLSRMTAFGNRFPFEYLEPNTLVNNFNYAPQQALLQKDTITVMEGDSIEIQSGSLGQHTHYIWYKNGVVMDGETETSLWVKDFNATKAGTYYCSMTNDSLPLLTLERNPVTLNPEGTSAVTAPIHSSLEILPNPASEYIFVHSDTDHSVAYIYDFMGKAVATNIPVVDGKIEVSSFPEGNYILLLSAENGLASGRFFKSDGR